MCESFCLEMRQFAFILCKTEIRASSPDDFSLHPETAVFKCSLNFGGKMLNRWLLIVTMFMASQAQAVDLTNRLGLGFSQQMGSVDLPMVTAHYYPNARFAVSGALGIDTEKDNSQFAALAKIRRVVFTENQLNFYMGAAGGFTTHEEFNATTAQFENKSNTEISALLGAEFFFSGLDSLSFMFETGVGIITGDGGTRFRTIGNHPFNAGIVFYF